ncbi:MAG TPA: glycosyltransferase family 39 protein, partial [Bryobacteraceae bacterium]|nr:glycosyltransferase family 39 protein [Bryobacteraceae bacterium]
TGAAALSLLVFAFCAVKLARAPVFLACGALLFVAGKPVPRAPLPPLPRLWKWIFGLAFAFYAVLYLSNSLAPEMSPDGSAYHLGLVARYFRQHGFERLTTNMYGNLSQGMEMLFLFAFAFGRHSAAATVHSLFLFTLPLLILNFARRTGHPRAGVCAAILVYLSPVVGIDGVSAYNDVALSTVAFAMFYLLEIWHQEGDDRLLIPVGLLAGFCFAIKYTGIAALLYALLIVRKKAIRIVVPAAAIALPWLVKNWIWVGNPFSPFLNRLFPNPFIHVSFEESYRRYLTTYSLPSLKPLFWIVTVSGQLGGQVGPLFLLAPVALMSLRTRVGQRCLLAALVFLIPYPQNIGARFLIPALPFLALAIALALEFSQAATGLLVVAAAVLAWPRVIDRYRAPAGGWQITTMPWQAALGIVPEETYLTRRSSDYVFAQKINQHVPKNKRIWSSRPLPEAWIDRDVLVYYYSAEGESIEDVLLTPSVKDMQPLWDLRFTFPSRRLTHLRVLQTAASGSDIWSIGEARFYDGDREVEPSRASAVPFPWDIGLALDHNPVTRWRSWESIRSGMHVDFDFAGPVQLDHVDLYCSHDQWKVNLRLDGIDAGLQQIHNQPTGDLRRLATRTVKARGIDYLVIGGEFTGSADIRKNPRQWGLRLVAEQGSDRLYEIQ